MHKQQTTQSTPVIPFTDNASNDIEQTADSLHARYLPPQGMSRAKDILPFLPFSNTTLFEWSRDGRFPAPVKLSPTMTAWRNADVIAWLEGHTTSISDEV